MSVALKIDFNIGMGYLAKGRIYLFEGILSREFKLKMRKNGKLSQFIPNL